MLGPGFKRTFGARTVLQCTVSIPIQLRKILIHTLTHALFKIQHKMTVNLIQHGRTLVHYIGPITTIPEARGIPRHSAADGGSTRVDGNMGHCTLTLTSTLTTLTEATSTKSASFFNIHCQQHQCCQINS